MNVIVASWLPFIRLSTFEAALSFQRWRLLVKSMTWFCFHYESEGLGRTASFTIRIAFHKYSEGRVKARAATSHCLFFLAAPRGPKLSMTPSHAKVEDTVHMAVQGFQLGPSTVSFLRVPVAAPRADLPT